MTTIAATTRPAGENHVFRMYCPLYGFRSDLSLLRLSGLWEFHKYTPEVLNGVPEACVALKKYLSSFPPDYLLIFEFPSEDSFVVTKKNADGEHLLGVRGDLSGLSGMLYDLLLTLMLFKEGDFFNSGFWTYVTGTVELPGQVTETVLAVADEHIHSTSTINSIGQNRNEFYYIDSAELSSFQEFDALMDSSLQGRKKLLNFAYAFDYFTASYQPKHIRYKFTDLTTCLEALLLPEQGELSHRLAIRVASLIGATVTEKKNVVKQVKEFYDVRSKLVHGSDLKVKHFSQLENLPKLRQLVRRTLLGSFALVQETGVDTVPQFHEALVDMEMDEELRKRVLDRTLPFLQLKM